MIFYVHFHGGLLSLWYFCITELLVSANLHKSLITMKSLDSSYYVLNGLMGAWAFVSLFGALLASTRPFGAL